MFLIFDTETTGLPLRDNAPIEELHNWPRIVQIAWQVHDRTGKILEVENMIIRPDGFEIPYAAEKVHGISTEMARTSGIPIAEAMEKFAGSIASSSF
ncbi:MAG: 3'-5' exonuclease, partial [Bacteroidales bacterium]|nr:3'-5' exonuclease [Bacteroidales bacterium]